MSTTPTILVTGATGFVGRHCVSMLNQRFAVTATGRSAPALAALAPSCAATEQLDLTAPDADRRLAHHTPAVIVHCAALSSPWGHPEAFRAANVDATDAVIRACRLSNAKLVHLSTPTIYMDGVDGLEIDENARLPDPFINDYAQTKFEAERRVVGSRLDAAILRPQAIIGAGDTSIAPRFLRVADRGIMPVVRGRDPWLDMTHVRNVVAAVELGCAQLLAEAWSGSHVFNITNGDPRRLSDLLRVFLDARAAAVGGRRVRMVAVPKPVLATVARVAETIGGIVRREPPVTSYTVELLATSRTLDIGKARAMLGYDPSTNSIEQAFVDYFAGATQ